MTSPHDLLLRAALLAGLGSDAPRLAAALSGLLGQPGGRSCLEAGSPVQVTVDAPGPAELRVGVRTGGRVEAAQLGGLVAPDVAEQLASVSARIPLPHHASLGTWVFWSRRATSLYVDLRDPNEEGALARARVLLGPSWNERLTARRPPPSATRPWAVRLAVDGNGITRAHMLWLIRHGYDVADVAASVAPGLWPSARSILGQLLRRPAHSGRFVVTTPLDDPAEPGLRLASTGWALVPEDDDKRRALAHLLAELGGPRDHAEALWSLCRADATGRWRVGRACEVRVTPATSGVRLFLTPQLDPPDISGDTAPTHPLTSASTGSHGTRRSTS